MGFPLSQLSQTSVTSHGSTPTRRTAATGGAVAATSTPSRSTPPRHHLPAPGGLLDQQLNLFWVRSGVVFADLVDASLHAPSYDTSSISGVRRRVVPPPLDPLTPPAEPLGVRVALQDGPVVVVFNHRGVPYVTDAVCPHAGGPLEEADIEEIGRELCIVCPRHGYSFVLRSGGGVGSCAVPQGAPFALKTYAARVDASGEVAVGLAPQVEPSVFRDVTSF